MRYIFAFWLSIICCHSLLAAEHLERELTLEDARHLLNRSGFGATARELNRYIGMPRSQAIDLIVDGLSSRPASRPPAWINGPAPHHWTRNELAPTERRIFNDARDQEIQSLRLWWIREMIETGSPQAEKLTLFWHNHFATAFSAINDQSISIARQHMMFREHGSGNFKALLRAVIRDPAMLNYLDNDNSRKQSPNENLARELFELFTLGEGNYTERDIKNAARALTGYTTSATRNLLFQFKPENHDTGVKTVFGQQGKFNADNLIDLILEQPATARFIAAKFWSWLVSDVKPSPEQLKPLAKSFRRSGYNITMLYREILRSEAFWQQSHRATIVHSPVSLVVGAIRSTGVVPSSWQTLPYSLQQLGQNLFEPPNVAGWPGGATWVTPGRLLNRLEWLDSMSKDCTGENCTSSSDMMAMAPAMQPDSSNTMTMSDHSLLSVRLAADSFEGPARFRIDIHQGDNVIWSTPETAVIGGHDTKAYGPLPPGTSRPWQTLNFKLDTNIESFDAVSVHFVNDHAGDGGDRNLFIDWVMLNQTRYEAAEGTQVSQCPQRKTGNAGNMYCAGHLLLGTTAKVASTKKDIAKNTLRAGSVFMRSIQNPSRRAASYGFTLTDVEFDNRHWHNLSVRLYRSKDNSYHLRLMEYGCWPDCVQKWPSCRNANKAPAQKMVSIALNSRPSRSCEYNSLTNPDKRLIRSLWHSLPELYQISGKSRRVQRGQNPKNHAAWQPFFKEMEELFQRSGYNKHTATLEVLSDTIKPSMPLDTETDTTLPLPGGRSIEERSQDVKALLRQHPGLTLAELLLPAGTANRATENQDNELSTILSDLAFQLH